MEPLALSDSRLTQAIGRIWPGARWATRDVLSDWQLSRVERVAVSGHPSVILKRSSSPLTDEGRNLEALCSSAIPRPEVYLAYVEEDSLTLLMEDLGPAARQPTEDEAAACAVLVHSTTPPPEGLARLDSEGLRCLLTDTRDGIKGLASSGRWIESADRLLGLVDRLDGAATALSEAAEIPPFGLCHSEFHPTSLHVGTLKTSLVDWARAYVGPGLLDLASWFQNGPVPPEPAACRSLFLSYVDAGGPNQAADRRGGLDAEYWALFWNRLWGVEWFVRCCNTWMTDRSQDPVWQQAVERHLHEASEYIGS